MHIPGYLKAFGSKPFGIIWLATSLLFIAVAFLYTYNYKYWWLLGVVTTLSSQILIISFWQDARFGTIVNVFILFAVITGYATWKFENTYKNDVMNGLQRTGKTENDLIAEVDLDHLPAVVQKYLRYTGVINKPKVNNVKIMFEGEMRGRSKNWFRFTSEQHNFFDDPERFFFMKARINGFPAHGLHSYKNNRAGMLIKFLSVFPVVNVRGTKLFQAETVTFFNDMCLFAPARLIDKRIQWKEKDNSTVEASFINHGIRVSAILQFNESGQLINFVSDDRCDVSDMKQYRFSTPVSGYKNINGYNIGSYGEATWHYPEGTFTYGKFHLKYVAYNVINH